MAIEISGKSSHVTKILFLGEGAVGKTTLAKCVTCDGISKEQTSFESPPVTIGLEVHCLNFSDEKNYYSLSLWDFAGQPQFRFFQEDFIKGSLIAVLVFDVNRQSSLLKLKNWYDMVTRKSKAVRYLVIGNKTDSSKRSVPFSSGQAFASKIDAHYLETSAKTFDGVTVLRKKLQEMILEIRNGG